MKKKSGKNRHPKTSDRQMAANRQNAKASTGPGTPEGLENSCRNATTHGGYSGKVLMAWESKTEFDAFYDGLWHLMAPENELEENHLDEYIWEVWRLRRLRVYEANILSSIRDPLLLSQELERFTRIQMRVERSRDKALKAFVSHRERMQVQEKRDRMAYLHAEMTRPPMMDDESFFAMMQANKVQQQAETPQPPAEQPPPRPEMASFRHPPYVSFPSRMLASLTQSANPIFTASHADEPPPEEDTFKESA